MKDKRITVQVEELTLSNALQITAIVELLEQKGILSQDQVIGRMRAIRDRKKPS